MLDPAQIPLFALANRKFVWIDRRQQLLSQNVADADTPGWRARDLKPFAALLARPPVTLAATEGTALPGSTGPGAPAAMAQPTELAPDGNSVVLDKELMKVAETDTAHESTVELTQAYPGMFRTAIGR